MVAEPRMPGAGRGGGCRGAGGPDAWIEMLNSGSVREGARRREEKGRPPVSRAGLRPQGPPQGDSGTPLGRNNRDNWVLRMGLGLDTWGGRDRCVCVWGVLCARV